MHMCLLYNHGEMYTNDVIAELITSEIYNNNQYYIRYYSGDIKEMLRSLDMYITQGVYSHQIVDIVVLVAGKCLSVNLCIHKKYGDNAILYMQPSNPPVPDTFICGTIMNIMMLSLLKTVHFKKAKTPK